MRHPCTHRTQRAAISVPIHVRAPSHALVLRQYNYLQRGDRQRFKYVSSRWQETWVSRGSYANFGCFQTLKSISDPYQFTLAKTNRYVFDDVSYLIRNVPKKIPSETFRNFFDCDRHKHTRCLRFLKTAKNYLSGFRMLRKTIFSDLTAVRTSVVASRRGEGVSSQRAPGAQALCCTAQRLTHARSSIRTCATHIIGSHDERRCAPTFSCAYMVDCSSHVSVK